VAAAGQLTVELNQQFPPSPPAPPIPLTRSYTHSNAAEHKEWRRRLQKAVDKLRDVLCSCLVAEFMYGHDGQPILTAHQYLHMDAKMRPTQWALKPLPSPPFQVSICSVQVSVCCPGLTYFRHYNPPGARRGSALLFWVGLGGARPHGGGNAAAWCYSVAFTPYQTRASLAFPTPLPSLPPQALYMALHSIHSTATYVLGGRDRVVTLLLMRLAEWLMMGLMVYSSFWDELENAEYALGPTGLQQVRL
ncbi:unnamed protein product, partial [Closterium sp. NIES-54]